MVPDPDDEIGSDESSEESETEPSEATEIDPPEAADDDAEYDVSSSDRTWGILTHASAFVGFVIPFGNILAPLIIWAIKKDESRFIDENGKEAINFQITWTVLLFVVGLTIFLVIGLVLVPIVALAWVILVVIAIIRASNDEVYDYPLTIDLIS